MGEIDNYFDKIEKGVALAYEIANAARKKGKDIKDIVEIPLAKNLFERVEKLVGAVKPELINSGLAQRLEEIDKKYGSGDLRVALEIGYEVAQGKFCKFVDKREAIEVGIRVALAYITNGSVSAPLEGFIEFQIKKRMDGQDYGALYFAGPIRAAGGTGAAVSLLIGDYLSKKFGLKPFDITKEEIRRTQIEIEDYHNFVARLQYYPTEAELEYLLSKLDIEVNGDPTSEREVLILKDLPRVGTSKIRGGICLVLAEGLAQKAKKIVKMIEEWGKDFDLENWLFLKEFIDLQKKMHTGTAGSLSDKIKPNTVFMEETVAGRPIFSYPMTKGGWRLRYGRTRITGLAASGVNPAAMSVLGNFIATGSQIKVERPGKAATITPCDTIDGPIVKLDDESVIQINNEKEALKYKNRIKEVLFIGDILVTFSEFYRLNHVLVPSPYVHEWWIQEVTEKAGKDLAIKQDFTPEEMIDISLKYNVPLHPKLLNMYNFTNSESIGILAEELSKAKIFDGEKTKIVIPHNKLVKKILEDICVIHSLSEEGIVIDYPHSLGILYAFGYLPDKIWKVNQIKELVAQGKSVLEILNSVSKVKIMDTVGMPIGTRLGRPEKAKMRKLKGSPHALFPVGLQGERLRSINSVLENGFVEAEFPLFKCLSCGYEDIFPRCFKCGGETTPIKFCPRCEKQVSSDEHCGTKTIFYSKRKLDIRPYVDKALSSMNVSLPNLIKGVRGLSSKERIPEPIEKGILRAINDVYVNKDGTVRFDAIETPITHFKPKEIGVSIEKLKELGYNYDKDGNPLIDENQIVEMFPQDLIIPDCREWEGASGVDMAIKVCNFIDDLLVKYYNMPPFYNVKSPSDIIGHLVISLAPHTSAGVVGRIIGFSKTQGYYAHPYMHSACRRNCDGDELSFFMLMDALLNFSRSYLPDKRGSRFMDLPLVLTTKIDPQEVDDEVYNMDIVNHYDLNFYRATLEYKSPNSVKVKQVKDVLGKPEQYRGLAYTHEVSNINIGNKVSSYKTLLTIMDKVNLQMEIAKKVRASNGADVARILIEKHFLKDIKGNMRKFSAQEFRCVICNTKYRRIPLSGRCTKKKSNGELCNGKLLLTISEGSVGKYLWPSIDLAKTYDLPSYLVQTLEILKRRFETVFGKETTKQTGLLQFS